MVEKLMRLERQLSDEFGPFRLFGLFLREDANEKWDLVVAADWLKTQGGDAIDLLSERLKVLFSRAELMMVSRIVSLSATDRFLSAVTGAIQVVHGLREVSQVSFAGVDVDRGYVITSEPNRGRR